MPPARMTERAVSTTSRKYVAGFRCWYLISTEPSARLKLTRPSVPAHTSVARGYRIRRVKRDPPSLDAVSATMKLSTACKGGVVLASRASLARFTVSATHAQSVAFHHN